VIPVMPARVNRPPPAFIFFLIVPHKRHLTCW
jgi:hypothetical protein